MFPGGHIVVQQWLVKLFAFGQYLVKTISLNIQVECESKIHLILQSMRHCCRTMIGLNMPYMTLKQRCINVASQELEIRSLYHFYSLKTESSNIVWSHRLYFDGMYHNFIFFFPTGPRAYHGTAAIGHIIYVVGGFDGLDYFNSVRSFDPVEKVWSEVAPMNAKRQVTLLSSSLGMGCHIGCLFNRLLNLTHLCRMEFPTVINQPVHFRFKGCWVVVLLLIQKF